MRHTALALTLLAAACSSKSGAFICSPAIPAQCVHANGANAVCIASTDRCAIPDTSCPSGFRYDNNAGPLSGTCVAPAVSGDDMSLGAGGAGGAAGGGMGGSAGAPGDMAQGPPAYQPPGWTSLPSAPTDGANAGYPYKALVGVGGDLYATSGAGVAHSTDAGKSWHFVANKGFGDSVWADNNSDIFMVGTYGVSHSVDGSGTTWSPPASQPATYLNGVWGTGSKNIFAVTLGKILVSRDGAGAQWDPLASDASGYNYAVGGSSSDIYVPGLQGKVQHSGDGKTFSTVTVSGGNSFYGVWATGAEAWLVGGSGAIAHSVDHGATWAPTTVKLADGTMARLNAAWGSSTTDIWAVGNGGAIFHSADGSTWQGIDAPFSVPAPDFVGVWGSDAQHVFVLGADGSIYETKN